MKKRLVIVVSSFMVALALAAGCGGGEADLGGCPPGSDMQQAAGQQVVLTNCVNCHSSKLTGAARQDAPDEYNFDDLAVVRDEAGEMYHEVLEGYMPPSPAVKLPSSAMEDMRVWLACGAKDFAASQ